jgi:glycosyltransferase involved in cell wall biosynthesis
MNISVALTTYNGARFLQEQLQSIADQSSLPDQLIIVDDRSSDETKDIIETFARKARFPVDVRVNGTTLGSTRNFQTAVELCSGDVIVLCDQDDRWHPEKLFQIKNTFSSLPNVGLVFSDAELIDEHGKPLNRRLWQHTLNQNCERDLCSGKAFEVLLQRDVVTGATMAFRQCFRKAILPFPTGIPLIHDGWAAVIIAAVSEIASLRECLIQYRVHDGQCLGIEPFNHPGRIADLKHISRLMRRSSYYSDQIRKLEAVRQRLNVLSTFKDARLPSSILQTRLQYVEGLIDHFCTRGRLPSGKFRRAPMVLKELLTLRYHRYSRGWLSAARDLTI